MGSGQRSRWATEGDFDKWRPTITRLYMEEGKVLREAMKIMEDKHDFHATAKMYKQRILKWGLRKYNKRKATVPPSSSAHEEPMVVSNVPQSSTLTVPDTTEDSNADITELSIVRPARIHTRPGGARMRLNPNASSIYKRLNTPDDFRLPEEVILLSQQFGFGLLEQGHWADSKTIGNPESNQWWGRTLLASQFLDLGKYKQAFKTLNQSFEHFSTLLEKPDLALIQGAYLVALQLDHRIGGKFLSYAAEMAAVKLPARHPLRIILSKLRDAGTLQLRRHALQILEMYNETLEAQLGPSNSAVLLLYENMYDTLDFLSTEKEMNMVGEGIIEGRQLGQIERLDAAGLMAEAQSTRLALSFTYWRVDRVEEAEKLNDGVLEWLRTHPKSEHSKKIDLWDSYYVRFRCKEKTGTKDEVERVAREYINVLVQETGWDKRRTIAATGHLQKYYKDHGYIEEAKELEKEVEAASRSAGLLE
ncbi:hypothetical protein PFICI_03590 [Pestalotiopsis fici W106-1]|uniref:Clr5 domain-containing protein n=1 Tax=Pestalotiopsis fici (strain W106-1 / CGMCC3.15140) TaxID=1229662 RepID=W3XHR1_PESFW|nr:uncharacterized protein PFICI_03590 [Pestalotiopsis fici W106-1]ETS85565.1 hypothetical protein PFICI_03590 [Pestalotiopsis fici W106-1]